MAKCLHQNTKAQSLIFCEPGKEGKDGNQPLPTSFPHLGQVTASSERSYLCLRFGYTFYYTCTFLKISPADRVRTPCQVWSSLPRRGDQDPKL